jgi:hypothetical protein
MSTPFEFKPPPGPGLSLEVPGVLKGGGFVSFDPARGRYAGIISIDLFNFAVTATVIINTEPEFSLLVILTADFRPVGLDISFGFTINAVGGLVGLDRGVDVNALREGIRNNAISSLMFPANPIENGPRIISDLERVFPAIDEQFLVGPMFELGWGKPTGMFTLALGVIIQIPDPKIVIVGVFRVLVPPMDQALLRLQVNFKGDVQFDKRLLSFDAGLYDSRLAMYSLEGDMAARLRWGTNAEFLVTVGGFSPRYSPAADLEIGPLRRVAINLLPTSDNPRLRLESYYAVTSNTLQHGARLEAYAEALGFSLRGFLQYDILAEISPLYIEANLSAQVGIFFDDEEIMGLRLNLHVTGPSPWHVDGFVSFKFIIKRITIPVRATFGSSDAPALPDIDVADKFIEQIQEPRNWKAILPDASQTMVQLARAFNVPAGKVVAHPAATIEFNQAVVPLNVTIARFGAAKPSGAKRFELSGMSAVDASAVIPFEATEPLQNEFAPAQYFNLTSDERLSAPAFRRMDSGRRANAAHLVRFGKPEPRVFKYREDIIDPLALDGPRTSFAREKVATTLVLAGLAGSAVGRSDLYSERVKKLPTGDEVKISDGNWSVVDKSTLSPAMVDTHNNPIAANQALGKLVEKDPSLAGKLMIVADYEMV